MISEERKKKLKNAKNKVNRRRLHRHHQEDLVTVYERCVLYTAFALARGFMVRRSN